MSGLYAIGGAAPDIAPDAFLAPDASVIGDVAIGPRSSVWFGCVLRGDVAPIRIGAGSNIQDGSVIHADPGFPTVIGDDVLIGHMVLAHGCTILDRGFVGMGAILLNGSVVESGGMLAAGALLTGGKTVGAGELWAGRPAKLLRRLGDAEIAEMQAGAGRYVRNAERYRAGLTPVGRG